MGEMISLSGLGKRFGPIAAVEDITLSVAAGEVLGFLGPNGAGKTTTMRMITGFLAPTSGSVMVCGHDVTMDPIKAQRRIGYLPEGAPLYGDMTPAAFLDFIAAVRGFSGAERKNRIRAAADKVEIASVLHRPIDTLSKGYKRRVGLAQAILHDPDVLILDEPTDGLDPNQKIQVRALIRDMSQDKAIVISTHILEEVEAVCTRAVIIADGRLVFDGTPLDLRRRSHRHNAVLVTVRSEVAAMAQAGIEEITGVVRVEREDGWDGGIRLLVIPQPGRAILNDVSEQMRQKSLNFDEIYVELGRLDDVFHELTTQG